jgi:putative tricarboxylic transport membrane protein
MRAKTCTAFVALLLGVCLALAACGADRPMTGLRVMVPNNPGSGYDVTARSAVLAMEQAGLARSVEVFNLPGASGAVGLQRLVNERGNGALLMQMGLGVVGAVHTTRSPVSFADTTPIARLTEDPEAVVVAADSPYGTLDELMTAWRADPLRIAVAGGSSPGGPDHLAAHLLAQAVGLDPRLVGYREYDGGGDLLAALLGSRVAFGVSSPTEFRDQIAAGQLRVLAVTSAQRVPGVDAPTLRDAGVDLQFANWRGLVAPPGLADADRRALTRLVDELRGSPEWAQVLARMNVTDAYLTGDEFGAFLRSEDERVAGVLHRLGLAA